MKIKYLDLKKINNNILKKNKKKIYNQILSGRYILPKSVNEFENNFKNFCKSKYCVSLNSGHDAIKFSLLACGIKKGDNVIVPAQTFISTWFAVSQIGANPICVDIDEDTGLISNENLLKIINKKKIKCVIFVHLYGNICQIDKVKKTLKKKKISIIEDCSQAHGGYCNKVHSGNFGDVGTFSFYPGKNLGGIGDGGAIVTKSKKIYEHIKQLRNYGSKKKYFHEMNGFNSRLNSINATFLNFKLKILLDEIKIRNKQIDYYKKIFSKFSENIKLMKIDKNIDPANHIFYIRIKQRDKLKKYLDKKKIETLIHYPLIPPLQKYYVKKKFQNYKKALIHSKEILSLPIGSHLRLVDIKYVSNLIIDFFNKEIVN